MRQSQVPKQNITKEHQDSSLGTTQLATYHYITSLCTWPGLPSLFCIMSKTEWWQRLGNKATVTVPGCVSEFEFMSVIYVYRIGETVLGRVIFPLYSSGFLLTDLRYYFPIYACMTVNCVWSVQVTALYKIMPNTVNNCWEVMQGAMKMPDNHINSIILCGYDLGHLCGSWWSIVQLL